MKKNLLLILIPFFTVATFAQIECEWDDYGLYFELPEDFKIVENNSEGFAAEGDAMEFAIYPFYDDSLETADITLFTLELADELDLDDYHDADVIELNGLEGAYVEGELDGIRVFLMGIIDPQSDTNFFALIKFYNDDGVAADAAIDIVLSFERY